MSCEPENNDEDYYQVEQFQAWFIELINNIFIEYKNNRDQFINRLTLWWCKTIVSII